MKVSVIIPTYNAEETISSCLKALQNQSFASCDYEIIVVDDGSTDNTQDIVRRFDVELLNQNHQGAGAARNLGAKRAKGEVILFTDADCEPHYNWIEEMCKPFHRDDIVGVKGFYRTKQQNIIARFAQIEYENKYDFMTKDEYIDFIDTYSAGYRREIFLKNGGFDPIYITASGEDSELSYRLASKGYKMIPVTSAIVYHKHPDTLLKYGKKKFRNAYWRVVTWNKHPSKGVRDSHTPTSLKLQVLLSSALIPLGFGSLLQPYLIHAFFGSIIFYFLATLPFTIKACRKDLVVGLFAPLLLLYRSFAFLIGAGTKILSSLTK